MKITFLGKPMTWPRAKNMWVIFNLYQGRGAGIINQFNVQGYLMLAASIKILAPTLPRPMYLPILAIWLLGTTLMGFAWFKRRTPDK